MSKKLSEDMKPVKVAVPDRVYRFNNGLYLTYRTEYERWNNKRFNNKLWETMWQWFVFAAFRPDMKRRDCYSVSQNGHTVKYRIVKYLAFFGFQIGFGHSHESKQISASRSVFGVTMKVNKFKRKRYD